MRTRFNFTDEQVDALAKSPHIEQVSSAQIRYTAAFKLHVYDEYQKGRPVAEIVREAEINPEWLGPSKLESLRVASISYAKRVAAEKGDALKKEKRITRLELELKYCQQELEFLKKIYMADREVWLPCESSQNQKASSKSSEK